MVAKRARQAVTALVATLDADLSAALRAVETADGITTNSLGDASDVVGAFLPFDPRDRLVQVFAESGQNDSDLGPGHSGLSTVQCFIVFSHNAMVLNEDAEALSWRWVDAICDVISADPTLNGQVTGAVWTDFDRVYAVEDESATRHVRVVGVEVTVC